MDPAAATKIPGPKAPGKHIYPTPARIRKRDSIKHEHLEDCVKVWRESFDLVAEDEDYIPTAQLEALLKSLGFTMEEEELQPWLCRDKIHLDNFLEIALNKQKQIDHERNLKNAFRALDINKYGYLSADYLRHILSNMGTRMSDEEVREVFDVFGIEDDDDDVDYDELVYIMTNPHITEDIS